MAQISPLTPAQAGVQSSGLVGPRFRGDERERRADETIESPARRAMRRLWRRKGAVAGLVVVGLFVAIAIFAPLISPYDPAAQSWTAVRT